MDKYISYSHQSIEEDDIKAVVEVLTSDFLTQGPKVKEFEDALTEYCGAKYAAAFSSGTAALHGAYFAAGLESEDEIITSPMTFLSTANAALFLGASPAFTDIEPDSGNIAPELIEKAITNKTKAIIPVHFAGLPAKMKEISKTAKQHKLIIIEDACHALGAGYMGTTIGDCQYSDMAAFSFHPVKPITTGEGGAVLTNNEAFYQRLIMFRHHGLTKEAELLQNASNAGKGWYYEMQHLGNNYRLTDIHSALGISQLKKLDRFIKKKRQIVKIYGEAFSGNRFFNVPVENDHVKSAWHLYSIRLKDEYKSRKAEIFSGLREKGLGVQVHYIPVYLQPYYQQLGYKKGLCPVAEDFYEREISIPLYAAMSREDIDYVIKTLLGVFEKI